MDFNTQKLKLYQSLLLDCFNKIKKYLPKKYSNLKDFLSKMTGKLKKKYFKRFCNRRL